MKRIITASAIALIGFWMYSCTFKTDEKPAVVDNGPAMKARFAALVSALNAGQLDAMDTLMDMNVVDHMEDTSMHLQKGLAGAKQMMKMYLEASPDMKQEIIMMTADDDILIAFGNMHGTNTGPMMGMPATNKAWSADFCDVVKFGANMKMTEHWGVYDQLKMMKDMGMIPSGPPPSDKKGKK